MPSSDPSRPPFESDNLVCMSTFNLNAVFFLNADPNAPNIMHSYRFSSKVWRNITLTGTGPDLSSAAAVVDFDTLVPYVYSPSSGMMRLGDAMLTHNANLIYDTDLTRPFSLAWVPAANNQRTFDSSLYPRPTLAHAHFNIYFFGVPGVSAGDVVGFRIHYGEWGSRQACNSDFAAIHGQATTFTFKYANTQFEHGGAPAHVAFIPDDYSAVYVINSYLNTTVKAPAPPASDKTDLTRFAANSNQLVQYTPETGIVRKLDFTWLQMAEGIANPVNPTGNNWVTIDEKLPVASRNGLPVGSNTGNPTKNAELAAGVSASMLFSLLGLSMMDYILDITQCL